MFQFFRTLLTRQYHVDFLRRGWIGLTMSACLSLLSVALFFKPGLTLGLDFRGGIAMEIQSSGKLDPDALRTMLEKNRLEASVQGLGDDHTARISMGLPVNAGPMAQKKEFEDIRAALSRNVPDLKVLQSDVVGATVSHELFRNGILALALSLLMILAYVWFRFEREFAVAGVVTLLLDLTKTMGFIIITGFEFDLIMVAALLTVLGYSTNDKIVVYDRIRENLRLNRSRSFKEVLNLSINETLGRTIATSSTLFLATLPLALFGGHSLTGFAWVMLFGIVVGTSSSIFIAAPLLLIMGRKRFSS